MSLVSGWRVAGAFVGCDEIVVFVLSAAVTGWLIGWLRTCLATLCRSWASALTANTMNAAAKTQNDGTTLNFVKTYFSLVTAIWKTGCDESDTGVRS